MIKALIWDMDGTLIDSEKHHTNGEIATFKEFGVDVTHEIIKEFMGYSLREYVEAVCERFNVQAPVEEVLKRHREVTDEYYSQLFPMVPHAREVIEKLGENYLQAVATSAEKISAEKALKRIGVYDLLQAHSYGSEFAQSKPNPEIFLKTAEKLGVKPEECVVIEDSTSGMAAARAAGMRLIARRAGHNQHVDFSVADFVVEDLLDVEKIVNSL